MKPFTLRMSIGAPQHLPLSRREVADQIDQLIDLLDKMETDADLEPDLGWSQYLGGHGWIANGQSGDDREEDDDREWDQAEQGIADMDGMLEQTGGVI